MPPQRPYVSSDPWEIIHYNIPQRPPHKTWTEVNIPRHSHFDTVHQISFAPLRTHQHIWIKWIFGLMWRPGFQSYFSYWKDESSVTPCTVCGTMHNQSIHGHISWCAPHGKLHKVWMDAWQTDTVQAWYQQAHRKDQYMIGNLVIPNIPV